MSTKYPFFCGTFAALLVCAPSLAGLDPACAAELPHEASLRGGEVLIASWYGGSFHGRTAASGCRYNMYALSAASRRLPLGSIIEVSRGSKSVTLTVDDRGPFVAHRDLDLSYGAAKRLDMIRTGVSMVRVRVIGYRPVRC